jgi:hypothetical protein
MWAAKKAGAGLSRNSKYTLEGKQRAAIELWWIGSRKTLFQGGSKAGMEIAWQGCEDRRQGRS